MDDDLELTAFIHVYLNDTHASKSSGRLYATIESFVINMLVVQIMDSECIMLTVMKPLGCSKDLGNHHASTSRSRNFWSCSPLRAYLMVERRVAISGRILSFTSKRVHPGLWILQSVTSSTVIYTCHPGKTLLPYLSLLDHRDVDRDVLYGMHTRQGSRQPKPIFKLHLALSLGSDVQSATVIAF